MSRINTRVVNRMIEIPPAVRALFVTAGWFPGRTVQLSPNVPPDHPAAAILTQFSGLVVGTSGPGEECATSDVAFQETLWKDARLDSWARLLRTDLVGVAEMSNEHEALYVDRNGRCYGASLISDGFGFEGVSFSEAIERRLLGRRSRPMLRPDQNVVRWYGEEICGQDPRIYHWD